MRFGPTADDDPLAQVISEGLTIEDWIKAGVVLAVTIVVAKVVERLVRNLMSKTEADDSVVQIAARLTRNLVLVIGIGAVLSALSVRITPLIGALGIGGLAIAFAAQSILENTFASVMLRARRPFRRGDQITTNDVSGTVEDVNFRVVVLRTPDGEKALVPCSLVLYNPILNHTEYGDRRTTLVIGVAYDSSLPDAQRALLSAAASVEGVRELPAPQALIHDFGDSSINIYVRFWHQPDIATEWNVRSDLAVAAKAALDEAGIVIPFPQRVMTFANALRPADTESDEG